MLVFHWSRLTPTHFYVSSNALTYFCFSDSHFADFIYDWMYLSNTSARFITGQSNILHKSLVRPYVGVLRRTSLMSSSLVLQQCLARLGYFTWIVCEMESRWLYSCCFVASCFQDLYKTVWSSHLSFSPCISLKSLWCIHTVITTQLQLGRNPILFY